MQDIDDDAAREDVIAEMTAELDKVRGLLRDMRGQILILQRAAASMQARDPYNVLRVQPGCTPNQAEHSWMRLRRQAIEANAAEELRRIDLAYANVRAQLGAEVEDA